MSGCTFDLILAIFVLPQIFVLSSLGTNNTTHWQQKLDNMDFTQHNLISSYYMFKITYRTETIPTFMKYSEVAGDFLDKCPKECLSLVMNSRDDFFMIFFFLVLSYNSHHSIKDIDEHFSILEYFDYSYDEKVEKLSIHFREDCNRAADSLWSFSFVKGDKNKYLEWTESLEIFLCIMKRIITISKEGSERRKLFRVYESLIFSLRNFEFSLDYIPSSEGFVNTFMALNSRSLMYKGKLPDSPIVTNLLRLFRYYSRQFIFDHLDELPFTVPALLLFQMLNVEFSADDKLFSDFSINSPKTFQSKIRQFPLEFFLLSHTEIWSFYSTIRGENKAILRYFKGNFPNFKSGNSINEKDFYLFLCDFVNSDPQDFHKLSAKSNPPKIIDLSEWDKRIIKVFLRLYSENHSFRLYQSDYLKNPPND